MAGETVSATGCPAMALTTHARQRVAQRRRRYITWKYGRKYGGTPRCKACTVDSTHPGDLRFRGSRSSSSGGQSRSRGQRDAGSAGKRQQWRRTTSRVFCSIGDDDFRYTPSETGLQHAKQTLFPWRTWDVRQWFTSHSQSHRRRRTWRCIVTQRQNDIAGLSCLCGEHHWILLPERCALRGTRHRAQSDERFRKTATRRSQSTWPRSLLLECLPTRSSERDPGSCRSPEHVRIGRQTELDSLRRHRVIEGVANSQKGTDVQGGCTEDCKLFPLCTNHFVESNSQPVTVMTSLRAHLHCWSSG